MLALLLCAAVLRAQNEDPVPTFRSEVSLVRVDAKVTGADGESINGLTAKDFIVYDEGERQKVLDIETETETRRSKERVNLMLLLDVSGSMYRVLSEMARHTRDALGKLHEGDQVGLMLFALRHEVAQSFTDDFSLVQSRMTNSIFKQTLGRGTVLNEALVAAARELSKREGRRAILVVTDNDLHAQKVTNREATRALDDADVLVNAIIVGSVERDAMPRFTEPGRGAPDAVFYAKHTGGEVARGASVGEMLRQVVESTRTRYTLQYAPPASEPGKFRRIRVELAPEAKARYPQAKIEARAGYTSAP